MKNWLNKTELWDKLSNKDKETFNGIIRDLREDLTFFNLYIKRNKKSEFNFNISFSKGMCSNFLDDLYKKSYGCQISELESIYRDYLIVKHFFKTLEESEDEIVYTDMDLKEIYYHFLNLHEIDLKDYISDFIGCSRMCNKVSKNLNALTGK